MAQERIRGNNRRHSHHNPQQMRQAPSLSSSSSDERSPKRGRSIVHVGTILVVSVAFMNLYGGSMESRLISSVHVVAGEGDHATIPTVRVKTTAAVAGTNERRFLEGGGGVKVESVLDNFDESKSPGWAVFYNLYIRPDDGEDGVALGLRVMKEQLKSVGKSYAAGRNRTMSLYYNTLGKAGVVDETKVRRLCSEETRNGFDCHFMEHFDEGFEEVTLNRVHEFCRKYPSQKVVYMHSKGSHHDAEHNRVWRRHMAEAVFSKHCLNPPDDTCNACGLLFFPAWSPMLVGNFWAADCQYVRGLLPPCEYRERMSSAIRRFRQMEAEDKLRFGMYTEHVEDKLCEERYSAECWIGSHPDLRPCDVSPTQILINWHNRKLSKSNFQFAMAPRIPWTVRWPMTNSTTKEELLSRENRKLRMKEFFYLPGNILKWFELYNKAPPDDSWVWDWFPDGHKWRRGVREYGAHAVDALVGQIDPNLASKAQR